MNFEYFNPTRLVFGAGSFSRLGELAGAHGKKALLVTGGGSVKKSGVFDRAVESLKAAGVEVAECSGMEPNPRISSVRRGVKPAVEQDCDLVIAIGGGSTMDAAKVMAAGALYHGDPWDLIFHGQAEPMVPTRALPIITAPTLAATGSEMNCGAVISDEESKIKSFVQAEAPARATGGYVTFELGARTAWHSHPLGQTLVVTAGCGRVQREGGPVEDIRPGDVVRIAPDEKHWHGAAPETAMTHMAIQEDLDGKAADWMEKVSDEQYDG